MKIQITRWLGLLLLTGMLAACGGGGKGNSTSANMGLIQAQLTVWQNKFATSIPPATDPVLAGLFDDTDVRFLHDGANKTSYLNNIATSAVWPIGATFSAPVAIVPMDVGVAQNDGTHQWFSTQLEGKNLTMLATQSTPGVWLFAGNQRKIGVDIVPFAHQTNGAITSGMRMELKFGLSPAGPALDTFLSSLGVTTATVSGPGLIGSVATPNTVPIFSSGSTQPVPECSLSVTTNCLDRTLVTPGIYAVTINGTPTALEPFPYIYRETVGVTLPTPTLLASFPSPNFINGISLIPHLPTYPRPTVANLNISSGSNLSVNWTGPSHQIPQYVSVSGATSSVPPVPLFYANLLASSVVSTNSTTLPVFSPASGVGGISVQISTTDPTTGMSYTSIDTY